MRSSSFRAGLTVTAAFAVVCTRLVAPVHAATTSATTSTTAATGPSTSTTRPASPSTTAPTTTATTSPSSPTSSSPSSSTSPSAPATTLLPTATGVSNVQIDVIDTTFETEVAAEVGAAQQAYDTAAAAKATADARDSAATAAFEQAQARLGDLSTLARQAAAGVQAARASLRDFAVAAYMSGGPGTPVAALLSAGSINDYATRLALFNAVATKSTDRLTAYTKARVDAGKETLKAVDQLQKVTSLKTAADLGDQAATARATSAAGLLADRKNLLTLASDAVSEPGTDIPVLVLDAYERAAIALGAKGCNVAWWAIAGVGRVESDHGRAQHAHLAPGGELTPPILGPALDGSGGTAAIRATDGGKFTGDPVWDHAVGPMQFIPGTWLRWGRWGRTGTGDPDPNNIYDAALSTATYLCAASLDLKTDAGLQTAYFSYNHSADYVAEVLTFARAYQAAQAAGNIPALAPEPLYTLAPTTTTTPPGETTTSSTLPPPPPQPGGTPVGPPGGAGTPGPTTTVP